MDNAADACCGDRELDTPSPSRSALMKSPTEPAPTTRKSASLRVLEQAGRSPSVGDLGLLYRRPPSAGADRQRLLTDDDVNNDDGCILKRHDPSGPQFDLFYRMPCPLTALSSARCSACSPSMDSHRRCSSVTAPKLHLWSLGREL